MHLLEILILLPDIEEKVRNLTSYNLKHLKIKAKANFGTEYNFTDPVKFKISGFCSFLLIL